jgi:GDP-4-dehydro-6-deoxy-D-mannose reductase
MNKYLITGVSGFVAYYLTYFLKKKYKNIKICGIDCVELKDQNKNVDSFYRSDLSNLAEICKILEKFQPDYIIHLAAQSSVGLSWEEPVKSFMNNMNIYLNLLEAVRLSQIKCRILSVGSSEEYGNVQAESIPLRESHPLNPISPYAVARVSQELISNVYKKGFNLDIVSTRSFNHFGPGQRDIFVVSSFAKQLAHIKIEGKKKGILKTGNIEIIRDFLDVRDVVNAYILILEKGVSGEVYNVCSGF